MSQLKKPTIKNPDLVAAMADFKQSQNKQTEAEMLKQIQAASFIAPITLRSSLEDVEPDENGQRQLQASLMAVSNKNGTKLFPAFTDWLEFLKWKNDPEAETMIITFDQYCDIMLKQNIDISGIVINPAETSIVVQKGKMAELKGVELPKAPAATHTITAMFGTEKITNSDVIIAASKLRTEKTPEAQNALFDALRKGRFVAPALMEDLPKTVKAGDKVTAKAEFIMVNHDDQKFLPLFTSLPELQKWSAIPSCKAVPMSLSQYIAMLNDPKNTAAGIVIDPFTIGLAFSKEQAMAIQPRLELQDLKVIPMDMLNELKEHMQGVDTIRKAYLTGVKANGTDGYLIMLDLDDSVKDIRTVSDDIATIAKKYGACAVAPAQSPMGQKAIEGKAPFYEA